jgi:aspartyl protease family protein
MCVCAAALAAAPADPPAEGLKGKGLARSGNSIVLADEAPLLESVKKLRLARAESQRETAQRKKAEDKIAANKKLIVDGTKEWKDLEKRLPKIKDAQTHNRTVARMNALAERVKGAIDGQKDLEQEANKVSSESKTKYVDELLALAPRVESAANKYKQMAADAEVKALVDKTNTAARANPRLAFGPSPDFSKAIDEVATWRSQLDSEAIPMREEGGVHSVEVIANGEKVRMIVDTGASHISLPFEVAKKVGLTPGENDPTVQMRLANGSVIDGKLMSLKSVRVGRFSVDNVSCVVFQEGLTDAQTVLGTSFLSHFVVKLNQRGNELYLTEVASEAPAGK